MWSFRRKPKPEDAVVPEMAFWDDWKEKYKFTPDYQILERSPTQRLFVCDEMMEPHYRHYKIKEMVLNPDPVFGFTNQVFGAVHRKLDNTVVALRRKFANVPLARIKGEMYCIPTDRIMELDKFKQNGLQFRRERVRLLLPYRTLTRKFDANERDVFERTAKLSPFKDTFMSAWMYIGVPEYWEQVLLQHTEESDGMTYFTKRYAMRENGLFLPKTTQHYRAVNIYKPHNRIFVENYYYHSRDKLNNS